MRRAEAGEETIQHLFVRVHAELDLRELIFVKERGVSRFGRVDRIGARRRFARDDGYLGNIEVLFAILFDDGAAVAKERLDGDFLTRVD